jgi:hypothetical protein
MYSERTSGKGCTTLVLVLAGLSVGVLGMWWMESRFGAVFAMAVLGSLLGALLVIAGTLLGLANSRSTLDAAARFNEALAMTEKHRQLTYREQARGDAATQKAEATLRVLNAKRVDQLAQQRANLLVDLERQKQTPNKQLPQWDDNESGEYRSWE